MSRFLLSLWLLGAVLVTANTLIILGWPTGKPDADIGRADNALTEPKDALDARSKTGESGGKEAIATSDMPAVRLESNAGTSHRSQTNTGQGQQQGQPDQAGQAPTLGGNASVPMPAMPPSPPQSSESSSQALLTPSQQDQSASQEQSQVQQQTAPPDQAGDWVRVSRSGANVRSAPSSSASRLATLQPGQELRVVSREEGWVQVASPNGSETGWIYERLLEPAATSRQQEPVPPAAQESTRPSDAGQKQARGEFVKVARPNTKVLAGPSETATMLFGFPEGRELRVLSRHSGWVLIEDPGSKQVGWIAESSLAPAGAEQQQANTSQRPNRSAPNHGAETADAEDAWMLGEENMGPPDEMAEPPRQPRKWGRRGGRLAGALRRALGAF